jgi:hypothetical protein
MHLPLRSDAETAWSSIVSPSWVLEAVETARELRDGVAGDAGIGQESNGDLVIRGLLGSPGTRCCVVFTGG